jgi:hypothetical protein
VAAVVAVAVAPDIRMLIHQEAVVAVVLKKERDPLLSLLAM